MKKFYCKEIKKEVAKCPMGLCECNIIKPDNANECGCVEYWNGKQDEWQGFSSCNLQYGCGYCGYDLECPVCKEQTGHVNQAGGVEFACGGFRACAGGEGEIL